MDIRSVFKSHRPIFALVFLESFCPVCLAYRFPRQHSGSSPSFPEAGLSRPTNGIIMVCYCLPRPRRSLTRIGARSQFSRPWHLEVIWYEEKMADVSAGVVNLQVWQLTTLFTTGTKMHNTWQPAACEGLHRGDSWEIPNQSKTHNRFHCTYLKLAHDEFRIQGGWSQCLSEGVLFRETNVKDSEDRIYKCSYKQSKRHAVKTL